MERYLYKQTKLAKTLELKLKTISNFKATPNFFNFYLSKNKNKKKKEEKKSCNKSVKLYFYYYTQKYSKYSMATFLKYNFPKK